MQRISTEKLTQEKQKSDGMKSVPFQYAVRIFSFYLRFGFFYSLPLLFAHSLQGKLEVSSVTGRLEPKEAPAWQRLAFRYLVSFPIIGLCLALVFAVTWYMLQLQVTTAEKNATSRQVKINFSIFHLYRLAPFFVLVASLYPHNAFSICSIFICNMPHSIYVTLSTDDFIHSFVCSLP